MRKLLWIFLLPLQVFATNYYVSNSGSDAAAGTIGAPWATISRVNTAMTSLVAGDSVLFQRGGEFFGSLTVNKAGVIIGAYGSGNLPIITGFQTLSGWTSAGTNLWRVNVPSPKSYMNVLSINGVMTRKGRYPDFSNSRSAWIMYSGTTPANTSPINVTAAVALPSGSNYAGGEVVIVKENYLIDVCPVISQSGNTLTCENPPGIYTDRAGGLGGGQYGFFIQNHISTLTTLNEWCYVGSSKQLTIYNISTPTQTIRGSVFDTLINVTVSSVTIENLDIQGSNRFGVVSNGGDFVLKNCNIRQIGYWGINCTGTNTTIRNNLVRDIGSNGIWLRESGLIEGNQVLSVNSIVGMGGNGNDQGYGIATKLGNTTVRFNVLDSIGYTGIRFEGNNQLIEKNFIRRACITKGDGGGIYAYNNCNSTNTNRRIKNNVVINMGTPTYGCALGLAVKSWPIYLDGCANGVLVDSNVLGLQVTVPVEIPSQNSLCGYYPPFGTSGQSAIYGSAPFNNVYRGNITFGTPVGFLFENYFGLPTATNLRVVGNAFYQNQVGAGPTCDQNKSISTYVISTGAAALTEIQSAYSGGLDSNYISGFNSCPYYVPSKAGGEACYSLANWKTYVGGGRDNNTQTFPAGTPEFQYNATATPTTYTFTGRQKRDFRGNTYNNSATIPAYYGNIFFDNGPAGANPPTASCSATTISCNGGSATVTVTGSGGTPPLSGTGTFTRTAGTYTFTVTDANGQTGTCIITITQPIALVASNTAGTITTVGGSANIVVTASGGTAPYSGTGTFSRTAGTYTFTVTDANGCTATTTRTLTNPSPVVVTCSATPILCNGGTSTVTVSASGGTGPYLNTGSFIRSAGSYTFSVTDAVGATGSCSVTITEPAVLVAAATAGTISSVGGTTSVVVTATGGVGPYTGTGTFTRGAGIHTFTVTDANGCTSFVIVSLNDPVIVAPQTLRINNIRFTNGN